MTFGILFCLGVNILIPNKRYAGIMKIIGGIFVVYTLIAPLNRILNLHAPRVEISGYLNDRDFIKNASSAEEKFSDALNDSSKQITEEYLKSDIYEVFKIHADVNADGESVEIYGVKEENINKVKKYIKEQYGIDAVVR